MVIIIFQGSNNLGRDAETMLKLGSTPDKREQYRLVRDAMERRSIRVTRGSIVGGIRLGMFTAAFYGFQNLLVEQQAWGSLSWRLRNSMLGSVPGAAICFPIGWLHLKGNCVRLVKLVILWKKRAGLAPGLSDVKGT